MNRKATAAGYFYPRDPKALKAQLAELVVETRPRERALAVISPHAGYEYSGAVAGAVFSSVELPETFIIVAPSHRPIRSLFATMSEGVWETPLGDIPVDAALAQALLAGSALIRVDPQAHDLEHSLEVQLPFLQTVLPKVPVSPVLVGAEDPEELARTISENMEDALIVVSSDLSHFKTYDSAKSLDEKTIKTITDVKPTGFMDACGELGLRALLHIAKAKGWKARLIEYKNSGDTAGDKQRVVGYASIEFS
jgi:AmmeMemoRadiSam system protein B